MDFLFRLLPPARWRLLCMALLVATGVALVQTRTQNYSGGYSGVTNITSDDQAWIRAHFGQCPDIECLMRCVENYAVKNFYYDGDKTIIFQYFDFQELVTTNKGICFDFACFFKNVCLVWAEDHNVQLKVYTVDIMTQFTAPRHSYSVIQMADGRNYYIDITDSIYCVQQENAPAPGFELFYESAQAFRFRDEISNRLRSSSR